MADFGLNESSNTIGELLPLLYFSQSLEQTKLRQDQNTTENRRQEEAMALRKQQVQESQEQHAMQKATLYSQIRDGLPIKDQLQGDNFVRKVFNLPELTEQDQGRDAEALNQFRTAMQTEKDPVKQREAVRVLRGTLSTPQGRGELQAIGGELEGQHAAKTILPIHETDTPEKVESTKREQEFLATVGKKGQLEFLEKIKNSKTATDTEYLRRILELRQLNEKGLATRENLIELSTLTAAQNLTPQDKLEAAHTIAIGRGLVADRFLSPEVGFPKEVGNIERGLMPLQAMQKEGGFRLLDQVQQTIRTLESRDDLTLNETYNLVDAKNDRTKLNKGVLSKMNITEETRDQALQKLRQNVATIEPYIKRLKSEKGIPGSTSQLHAYEAIRQTWRAEADALISPSSEVIGRLVSAKQRMTEEISFWNKEKVNSENERDRLGTLRMKQGTDKELRARAEKDNVAAGQQEFAALPKEEQTPQRASAIAKRLSDDTGVPVQVDDISKGAKDQNKPLTEVKVDLTKGLTEGVLKIADESRNAASGALDTMETVNRVEQAIKQGAVTLGPTATIRTKAAQVAQMLGVGGKDTEEQLVNTRNTMRGLAQFTLAARKQLKGQGQVSDYEGRLIQRAEGGEIDDFTLPELRDFVGVSKRMATRQYESHKTVLGNLRRIKGADAALVDMYDVGPMPKASTEPKGTSGLTFSDTDKEQRYQEWKAKQGR